ncbi:MAG: maleylpyruvate isomerase family mycothiol-dependent enzyme [Acidimicrobiales bacterium]
MRLDPTRGNALKDLTAYGSEPHALRMGEIHGPEQDYVRGPKRGREKGAEGKVKLMPRYGSPAVIDISALVASPSTAVVRQRDRVAAALSQLSPEEWSVPSRCAGWSIQDVAEHLVSVNQFWVLSVGAGLLDEPSRFLASFDPVTVPAALVERARGEESTTTLEKLNASNAELAKLLNSMSDVDWMKLAEAPPGHLAMEAVCAHALWDAWIHERDILLPLGRAQWIEPDEVATALVYAASLGPAFYLNAGEPRAGSLAVRANHPDIEFVVEVSDQVRVRLDSVTDPTAVIVGDAVDLIERFSVRTSLPTVADEHRWLVDGLQQAFAAPG